MRQLFFLFLLHLSILPSVSAQDFNYVHYDTKDGLAGSTIYDMCQDEDGFMWFATENGLSRYDGTRFKNFTVSDGLPDNEVLKVFSDSRGRVWIGTFNKEICYYYQGKMYTRNNSSLLSKINLKSALIQICEDANGNIIIGDLQNLTEVYADGTVEDIGNSNEFKKHKFTKYYASNNYSGNGFLIIADDSVFKYIDKALQFWILDPSSLSGKEMNLKRFADGRVIRVQCPDTKLNQTYENNTIAYVSTVNGAWSIDTVLYQLSTHFLPGKRVSRTISDPEGNIWFSTMGEGVFKLPSTETRTIHFPKAGSTVNTEVFSISQYGQNIICGLGFSKGALLNDKQPFTMLDYSSFTGSSPNNLSTNRLYCSKNLYDGSVVLGFDAYLISLGKNGQTITSNKLVAIKSIDEIDSNYILVGCYSNACKVRRADLSVKEIIWSGRCTKVLYSKSKKYYIGTINGLYEINEDKSTKYLGTLHPALTRRITDMKETADGTLWVATNDMGILAYKQGKVVSVLQDADGLTSNICKALYLDKNFLWIGTNKGLNKFSLDNKNSPVLKYGASDGLPSDIINSLYLNDSLVWVGSPAGLTYFNEKKIANKSFCRLMLLSVSVAGKAIDSFRNYSLSYSSNNIKMEYVAISFKSAGQIIYHYKLTGLDTTWQSTTETVLDYPSLPPGKYKMHLFAENKFGIKSRTEEFTFSIAAPFWLKWWFYTAILLVAVLFTGWSVNHRNGIIRLKLVEKNNYQKQFAALEQQALQAQMNPHFIFNCLNSIQQYILTNDKEKANEYLTGFARLIRQTLDNSSKKSITISEEVKYLTSYLEMEKMRFGDNFGYVVGLDDALMPDLISMPALLLQPYVENALRHGIRYKQHGMGIIDIRFSIESDILTCTVEDNGVGRSRAEELKSRQHIEYQSKGMSLTEKRIQLLNLVSEQKIIVQVIDNKDGNGAPTGTTVILKIPV